MIKPLPDRDLVRRLLDYDPTTGVFTWKATGRVAGSSMPNGRRRIGIGGTQYYAYRLAWLYERGEPVPDLIDHEDTDVRHDWIDNLRVATQAQNLANSRRSVLNKTGVKGVALFRGKRFTVMIRTPGRRHYIGIYDTLAEAAEARRIAAEKLHGSFCNNG